MKYEYMIVSWPINDLALGMAINEYRGKGFRVTGISTAPITSKGLDGKEYPNVLVTAVLERALE